jgi:preprotein translocase subunit YajC
VGRCWNFKVTLDGGQFFYSAVFKLAKQLAAPGRPFRLPSPTPGPTIPLDHPAATGRRFFRGPEPSPAPAPEEVIVLETLIPLIAADSSSGSAFGLLFPLLLMGGVFYFLLIRPQQRRQRQQRELLSSVDVGDEVLTIGGMYGTVRGIQDDELTLEVAPGIQLRFLRSAIARKLTFEPEDEEAGDQP